jgi:hypothetical protein
MSYYFGAVSQSIMSRAGGSPPVIPLFVECFDSGTFDDNFGTAGGTVSANSSWGYDSTRGPYSGTGSAGRLGGSTASYGELAHDDSFTGFPGQFTIDCWNYKSAAGVTRGVFSKYAASGNNRSWAIYYLNNRLRALLSLDGINETAIEESIVTPTGTWFHIALDRDSSNVVRLYRDGVVVASTTFAGTLYNNPSTPLQFNGFDLGNSAAGDRSAQYRITRGIALYAGAYTPPTARFSRP